MHAYIPTKDDLEEIIERVTREIVNDVLPSAIRKATRKEWLTTDEVMKMLKCSRRHVQYLRDSKQLTFYQNGKTIRYNIIDIVSFLNDQKVESRD